MNILFDIIHPADVNFFKASIFRLQETDNNVFVSYRDRGKLFSILSYELSNIRLIKLGMHQKTVWCKVWAQILRDFAMFSVVKSLDIDVVACFGSVSVIGARLAGAKFVAFDDDYEYKLAFYHPNLLANKHVYPDFIPLRNSRVKVYHGYKELAYLHPDVFKISNIILPKNRYCFIRVIGHASINYADEMQTDWVALYRLLEKLSIVPYVSIEMKEEERLFRNIGYNVLKEPVEEFYSFLSNAQFVITLGDTIAREASLLAVPTLYYGTREMVVNREITDIGIMKKVTTWGCLMEEVEKFNIDSYETAILEVRRRYASWSSTTEVILDSIFEVS